MGNLHRDLLSPSKSFLWVNCSASVTYKDEGRISDNYYENKQIEIKKREGVLAHSAAEETLNSMIKHGNQLHYKNRYYYTDEMVSAGIDYANYVLKERDRLKEELCEPVTLHVEKVLDCSEYAEQCIGTPDVFMFNSKEIIVIDYKYGKVDVSPINNYQLMIYALAVISIYKNFVENVDQVKLVIVQPNNGGIKEWYINKTRLINWGESTLKPAAKVAGGEHLTNYGDWCQYCHGKKHCKEYIRQTIKLEYKNSLEDYWINQKIQNLNRQQYINKDNEFNNKTGLYIFRNMTINFVFLRELKKTINRISLFPDEKKHRIWDFSIFDGSRKYYKESPDLKGRQHPDKTLYSLDYGREELNNINAFKNLMYSKHRVNHIIDNNGSKWMIINISKIEDKIKSYEYVKEKIVDWLSVKIEDKEYILINKALLENIEHFADSQNKLEQYYNELLEIKGELKTSKYSEIFETLDIENGLENWGDIPEKAFECMQSKSASNTVKLDSDTNKSDEEIAELLSSYIFGDLD